MISRCLKNRIRKSVNFSAILIGFLFLTLNSGKAEEASKSKLLLRKGDRIAILGDSITRQKLYSAYLEMYFLVCLPEFELKAMQFGWSGERAQTFFIRMENDLMPWKPTVATICYGMNDGRYRKYEEKIGKVYQENLEKIIERLKKDNVRVVVGTPGVVDSYYFKRTKPAVYNANLAELGKLAEKVAQKYQMRFADIHTLMLKVMEKAKAAYGEKHHVAGRDGVHPSGNGHLIMAYAFLRAIGVDGNIGTFSMNYSAGKTTTTAGHQVISEAEGSVTLESKRYPFCFPDYPHPPYPKQYYQQNRDILPFLPFQQDLNRLILKVNGLPTAKAKVKWGKHEKTFSSEQLEKGINLAAEFLDNPFLGPFTKIRNQVGRKQDFDEKMINHTITHFRAFRKVLEGSEDLKDAEKVFAKIRKNLEEKTAEYNRKVREKFVPVKHTIKVTPIK